MVILGLSAFYHDSAAVLLKDGAIVAAAQEERFTRRKHDAALPAEAIAYCLAEAGLSLAEVDLVAFYEKPLRKLERLAATYLSFAPRGRDSFVAAASAWLVDGKARQRERLLRWLETQAPGRGWADRLLFASHHRSHAASAFLPSPFTDAAIIVADGVGEWATTTIGQGDGARVELLQELRFPHSLGLLYSAFTDYLGFKVNSGEYKVMGLAPYGTPRYADLILERLVDLKDDGSFRLEMAYFDYCVGFRMVGPRFAELFGVPRRTPEEPLEQRHMDLAASVQAVTEEIMLRLARTARRLTGKNRLCLAGGVALNCVANGRLLREAGFDDIWVQPAAGDAGGALGAALAAHHGHLGRPRVVDGGDAMRGSYLGPAFDEATAAAMLTQAGARFERLSDDALIARAAEDLAGEKALGWCQGRMEFGPRALGNRSILADARSRSMQSDLNLKVKFRESFRPFAPAVPREDVADWFELDGDSPYMLIVAGVAERHRLPSGDDGAFGIDKLKQTRSAIPAVTHVDYSARIQTVHADTNPRFHALLGAFKARTGCPVLVNTSFNVRGEPIVCSPTDAFRCFMGSKIESLAVGNLYLRKEDQDQALAVSYENAFELD